MELQKFIITNNVGLYKSKKQKKNRFLKYLHTYIKHSHICIQNINL